MYGKQVMVQVTMGMMGSIDFILSRSPFDFISDIVIYISQN